MFVPEPTIITIQTHHSDLKTHFNAPRSGNRFDAGPIATTWSGARRPTGRCRRPMHPHRESVQWEKPPGSPAVDRVGEERRYQRQQIGCRLLPPKERLTQPGAHCHERLRQKAARSGRRRNVPRARSGQLTCTVDPKGFNTASVEPLEVAGL